MNDKQLIKFKEFWKEHDLDFGFDIYETACVSRLTKNHEILFPTMLANLFASLSTDGTLENESRLWEHNILSTLAIVNTLLKFNQDEKYDTKIFPALKYIMKNISRMSEDRISLANSDLTFSKEMQMLDDYKVLNETQKDILVKYFRPYLQSAEKRMSKYTSLDVILQSSPQTLFAFECISIKQSDVGYLRKVLDESGSILNNSATTARYYELTQDAVALDYLKNVSKYNKQNCAMGLFPGWGMETGWVLYNLHDGKIDIEENFKEKLFELRNKLTENGIGASKGLPPDADTTSVAFFVLSTTHTNPVMSLDKITSKWWSKDYGAYNTFENSFRSKPDISTNIHMLRAHMSDQTISGDKKQEIFNTLTKFLLKNIKHSKYTDTAYWEDRWNISPFYPTCDMMRMLSTQYEMTKKYHRLEALFHSIADWTIENQNSDGGFADNSGHMSTPEETAYAVMGLKMYHNCLTKNEKQFDKAIIQNAITRGTDYLNLIDYKTYIHVPFWVAKSLYCPVNIIQSAITSALNLPLADIT